MYRPGLSGLIAAGVALLLAVPAGADAPVAEKPGILASGDPPLALRSCGVRETLWIQHYVASLYAPPDMPPLEAVRSPDVPKTVRLRIINALFLPPELPEEWRQPLVRALDETELALIDRAYSRLTDGDLMNFSYLPDKGLTVDVNGAEILAQPGHSVIDSLIGAWHRGEASETLSELLSGNRC